MTERMRLVVASSNRGKLAELQRLLAGLPVKILGPGDGWELPDVPEDGETFEANARKKALAAMEVTGLAALADDSGLEVEALGGRPGVRSARFFGEDADDPARVRGLLEMMESIPPGERGARFVCAAALALPAGEVILRRGICPGRILGEPRGSGGFGYDPVFLPDGQELTFAELPGARKNEISHRGRALAAIRQVLAERL